MSKLPVWAEDFPDPFVLRVGRDYWAYGTNVRGRNVQVLHSSDLASWQPYGDALPGLPGWARPGFTWAPSVLARTSDGTTDTGYVLYVTVRDSRSDRQAILVASASSPTGPFQPSGDGPLVLQHEMGGSIDPSPFVDADGTAYLLWKADANALHLPSSLWAQPLSADGLMLTGSPIELLMVDRGWERPLIEAPAIVADRGSYYLFYSGGRWASDAYGIGYATADHPLGPWQKAAGDRAWFASDTEVSGPGGQEFFTDTSGSLWMAYHGWEPGHVAYRAGGKRTLRLTPVSFIDGRPVPRELPPGKPPSHRWWHHH